MDVVLLSSARWSLFRLSKQYIAMALARDGHRALYVDPPLSPLSVLRNRDRVSDFRAPVDESPEPGLDLWRPRVFPGQNSRIGQAVNAAMLRRGLLRRMPRPDVTIAFSLESRRLLSMAPGRRVYYCTDSFEDQPGYDARVIRRREQDLIDAAEIVVGCSIPLCDQLRARGAEPIYLPHAIDDDSLRPPGPVPEQLSELPRPLIGWAGTINWRVDLRLLEAARRAAGGGSLVIIGGGYSATASQAVKEFMHSAGVCAVGEVDGAELPTYLAALDVGLVPYALEPFNRKSFPIKVLQYLAAGLPVVSTPSGATDELGSALLVAGDPKGFEAAVKSAIRDNSVEATEARQAIARSRRWVDNARAVLDAALGRSST